MTRLPHENRQVKGRGDFESPEFLQQCSHPLCSESRSLESHHIWRRSFLGGAYNHVELWDGTIIGNVALLCQEHHRLITENKAQILWEGEECWWTQPKVGGGLLPASLNPQPPSGKNKTLSDSPVIQEEDDPTPYSTPGNAGEGVTEPPRTIKYEDYIPKPDSSASPEELAHNAGLLERRHPTVVHGGKTFHLHTPKEGEECPTCKRKVPAKKKREPAKRRGTITFRVPKDNEDGAEIVDSLLDQIREARGREAHKGWKYFVLVDCLVFVVQNLPMIERDS